MMDQPGLSHSSWGNECNITLISERRRDFIRLSDTVAEILRTLIAINNERVIQFHHNSIAHFMLRKLRNKN